MVYLAIKLPQTVILLLTAPRVRLEITLGSRGKKLISATSAIENSCENSVYLTSPGTSLPLFRELLRLRF